MVEETETIAVGLAARGGVQVASVEEEPKVEPGRIEMDYPEWLFRLWRITDNESIRYALAFLRIDFRNGFAEVTNGRILARESFSFPEEFSSLDPVLFWGQDLRKIAKYFRRRRDRLGLKLVKCGGGWCADNGEVRFRIQTDGGRFPDTESLSAYKPKRSARFKVDMAEWKRFILAMSGMEGDFNQDIIEINVPLSGEGMLMINCGGEKAKVVMTMMAKSYDADPVSIDPEVSEEASAE